MHGLMVTQCMVCKVMGSNAGEHTKRIMVYGYMYVDHLSSIPRSSLAHHPLSPLCNTGRPQCHHICLPQLITRTYTRGRTAVRQALLPDISMRPLVIYRHCHSVSGWAITVLFIGNITVLSNTTLLFSDNINVMSGNLTVYLLLILVYLLAKLLY